MGYRDYSTAKGHIVDATGKGDFTTIASALTAASSGQTIFIRPGTYTENLTLKAGVNLSAYSSDATTPNVTIVGNCTFTAAGTVSINGIRLQTNSNFLLSVTGTAASIVNLINCYLNCSNNTGISYTTTSASSVINCYSCNGNLGTTGIAYFAHSSAGLLNLFNCFLQNTGNSTTSSTISAGKLQILNCPLFFNAITTSGSSALITVQYSQINGNNSSGIVQNSTASGSTLFHSIIAGGTAPALTIGSGATLIGDFVTLQSSNTNAASGAGTSKFGDIIYTDSSSNNQITTQTSRPGAGWQLLQTLTASASATLEFKNIGIYNSYAFVFNKILPATNAQAFNFVVSANNGSTYASSGYTNGINYSAYNSATVNNVNSTTFGVVTGNVSNVAGFAVSGMIIYNATIGGYAGPIQYGDTGLGAQAFGTCGGNTNVAATNAFKFSFASGNIASGSISIYGIAQ